MISHKQCSVSEKLLHDLHISESYKGLKIRINWSTGYLEYNYADLLIRPRGVRQRDHDRFVRKLIDLGNQHGGWVLVDENNNTI